MSSEDAIKEIEKFSKSKYLKKINPKEGVIETTLLLLKKYSCKGYAIFDTYLVATMIANGVNKICTLNEKDFTKFEGIDVYSPKEILRN